MVPPKSSPSLSPVVVADTSTLINLNATGWSSQILQALPYQMHVTSEVLGELARVRREKEDANRVAALLADGLVTEVQLSDSGMDTFALLAAGSGPDTLGDGEASTIAYALETNSIAIVDERKGRRICASRFTELRLTSTVELLAHAEVQLSLGREALEQAVLSALNLAKMSVCTDQLPWLVDLIGEPAARTCRSLPRSVRTK